MNPSEPDGTAADPAVLDRGSRLPEGVLPLGLAVVALVLGLTGIREFDAFHHLAMGRHLLSEGLSGPEPFLYPLAGEPPLPPPNWLGSIAFYAAHQAGGIPGVVLLAGLAGAAASWLAAADALRPGAAGAGERGSALRAWGAAAIALVPVALAVGAWRIRAVSRPEVLGLAAFALTLLVLRRGGSRPLWALPPLFLAWACAHPSVAFGLGAIALALLDAALDARRGSPSDRARLRHLATAATAAAVLAAVAPGGALSLAIAFAKTLAGGAAHDPGLETALSRIIELLPPETAILLTPAGLLLLLLPVGWAVARRLPRPGEAVLAVALVALSARSLRFVPFAAFALAPLAGRDLADGLRRLTRTGAVRRRLVRAAPALALASLVASAGWSAIWLPVPVSLSVAQDLFPVRAADALEEALPRAPGARIWNALQHGGYLEWRLPGTEVFQDGRLAWAPGESLAALAGPADRALFETLERRWSFDALVVDYPALGEAPFVGSSDADPAVDRRRYALVAFDDGGLLYARRDGRLSSLTAREYRAAAPAAVLSPDLLLDPVRRGALESEYRRAVAERPVCAVCRAGLWLAVAASGDAQGAEAVLPGRLLPETANPFGHAGVEAIRQAAWALGRRRFEEGVVLARHGDLRGSSEALRASLVLAESGEARTQLGVALLRLGDRGSALRELERAVAVAPELPMARFGLALALEEVGRGPEAAAAFRAYLGLDPAGPWAGEARLRAARLDSAGGRR